MTFCPDGTRSPAGPTANIQAATACGAAFWDVTNPGVESEVKEGEVEVTATSRQVDVGMEEVRSLIFRLPAQELLSLADAIQEQVETIAMMQLAETGFSEWLHEGEDLYDAKA